MAGLHPSTDTLRPRRPRHRDRDCLTRLKIENHRGRLRRWQSIKYFETLYSRIIYTTMFYDLTATPDDFEDMYEQHRNDYAESEYTYPEDNDDETFNEF